MVFLSPSQRDVMMAKQVQYWSFLQNLFKSANTFLPYCITREEITDSVVKEPRNKPRFVHTRQNFRFMPYQWTKRHLILFCSRLVNRHTHTHTHINTHTHTQTHTSDFHLICGKPLACKCHVLGSLLWHPSHIYSHRKYNNNYKITNTSTVTAWDMWCSRYWNFG